MIAHALALVLAAGGGSSSTAYVGKVNLNTASVEQLELLPGVGRKAAQSIVAHRSKRKFGRIQELVRVKGFGRKKFLRLEPHLTVAAATDLQVHRKRADGGLVIRDARTAATPAR